MANDPHYQSVKRSIIEPLFQVADVEDEIAATQRAYSQLAQEVVECHNRVLVDQLVVPGGAANLTVLLPAPFPDDAYTPLCILDWAAYAYLTAIAFDQFTVAFSAAAPGGGGVLRAIIIR